MATQSILTDASFVVYLDKAILGATCISNQSKMKTSERCKNKRRPGSCLCGIHTNVDESRVVDDVKEAYITFCKEAVYKADDAKMMMIDVKADKEKKSTNLIKSIDFGFGDYQRPVTTPGASTAMDIEEVTEDAEVQIRRAIRTGSKEKDGLSVTLLRNFIKENPAVRKLVNTDQPREKLLEGLVNYFGMIDHYDSSVNRARVVKVQAIVRRWLIMRRAKCSNKTDIITMDSIYEIPGKFFYIFHDKKGKNFYGYDIRVFTKILYDPLNPKHVPKCPYTHRILEHDDIIMVEAYIERMRKRGVSLEIERPRMSKEKEIELKCIDIFGKMDHLDNYTNHRWFMDLSQTQLIKFYNVGRDIWNYRLGMPPAAKLNILSDGRAFEIKDDYLKTLPSKIALQNMVLNEVNRFVTEGKSREDKKLGAMLMLTTLVEVSSAAAQAIPHLVQIF
jgi:uncharacterized coiled-coil protein SlyX